MKSEITIKMARCKGCGICVAFCPKQVLALDELGKVHVKNGEACIACGQCAKQCPKGALELAEKDESPASRAWAEAAAKVRKEQA